MRTAVTILTSAVGLGIYIPALLIERSLRRYGIEADVEVLEAFYTPQHQRAHFAHRDAHHTSFALAQLAHRMARDVGHCLDDERLQPMLDRWRQESRRRFIVWAGFWLPVLERYRRMTGGEALAVDHCRIDAVVSASFKVHPDLDARGRDVWLWNGREERIDHEIPVTDVAPLDFAKRDDRLVVHGGGWGIGTYRSTLADLRSGYGVDVVVHDIAEARSLGERDRAFMLDPAWRVWDRDAAHRLCFPPMGRVVDGAIRETLHASEHHAMYDVIRASKAIVSKPGGCTLIDSLASATPVVLLEPYGYAEQANAELWTKLGFGIPYDAWRASGFDPRVLERLHTKIAERRRGIDYPRAYAHALAEACA